MKTVLVFDTDDPTGMKATIHIVEYLAEQYMSRSSRAQEESFGKIEFIKVLRTFMMEGEEVTAEERKSLRFAKRFSDRIWSQKKNKK